MTNLSGDTSPSELPPPDDATPNGPQTHWSVMRQDDNGNRFLVRREMMKAEALQLAAELESHGHKQLYWIEHDR